MNAPVRRSSISTRLKDTLFNLVTGLGGAKDKSQATVFGVNDLSQSDVEAMYRGDWVARKIVKCPADDATREWRSWQAEGDQIEAIEDLEKKFRIQQSTCMAMSKARLYGGAALVLGVDDGKDPSEELDVEKVQKDSLKFVHAVSRYELGMDHGGLETDLMSPYFGEPKMYVRSVKGSTEPRMLIHPSRVVRMMGEPYPDVNMSSDGWGESVLQAVHDAVRNAGLISQAVTVLMDELKVDVIKIPDLTNLLSDSEATEKLTQRLAYGMLSKSTVNALVMDSLDDWQRITANLSNIHEIIKVYLLIAAGAADIPATRLLSQSPTGLNSTGESDIRNYYDRIGSDQVNYLTPAMSRLDEVLIRSATGARDENIFYNWNPLWQLTEAELADIAGKKAATFKIDVDMMLIPTDALAEVRINQLVEDGTYPGLERAMEETDGEVVNPKLEAQLEMQRIKGEQAIEQGEQQQKALPKPPVKKVSDHWRDWNPDQPRDPGGEGGGQWIKSGGGSDDGDWKGSVSDLEKASRIEKLTPDEQKAVDNYSNVSDDILSASRDLRLGNALDPDIKKLVDDLEKAIDKRELPRAMNLYRGISSQQEEGEITGQAYINKIKNLKPGETLIDKGFAATGLTKSVAEENAPTDSNSIIMKIKAKRGDKALVVSGNTDQEEVLLQRQTQLKFIGKEDDVYVFETSGFVRNGRVKRQHVRDAQPRTLYVRRDVVNVDDIKQWAKAQGLPAILDDLHVTIMYSRRPVDWMKVGDNWNGDEKGQLKIKPGGVRIIEPLGNGEVVALLFTSSELSWRHEQIKRDAEAAWDWPDYQPHITLYKTINGVGMMEIEPYRGEIFLGPEIFEEVKEIGDAEPRRLKDEWDPSKHPRHEAGSSQGGEFSPSGSSLAYREDGKKLGNLFDITSDETNKKVRELVRKLSDFDWNKVPLKNVNTFHDLVATQTDLDEKQVKRYQKEIQEDGFSSLDRPTGFRFKGKVLIEDGHHKIIAARRLNIHTIKMHVVDLED